MSDLLTPPVVVVDLDGLDRRSGEPVVTRRLASRAFTTRADDEPPHTPYRPDLIEGFHLAGLQAYDDSAGYLVLGNRVLDVEAAALKLRNPEQLVAGERRGVYDELAELLFDHQTVEVRQLPLEHPVGEADLRPAPLLAATSLWHGFGRGTAELAEDQVVVPLKSTAWRLGERVQDRAFLGLGHSLDLAGGYAWQGGGPQEIGAAFSFVHLVSPKSTGGYLVAKHTSDALASPLYLRSLSSGAVRLGVRTTTGAAVIDSPPVPAGVWSWLAATWDGAQMRLYTAAVDGAAWTLAGQAAISGTLVTNVSPWRFGGSAVIPTFTGRFAVWGLWRRALEEEALREQVGRVLTQAEVDEDADLVAYVPFEPGFGPVAYDLAKRNDNPAARGTVTMQLSPGGWQWGLTLEGGAELAGQGKPITDGLAASVPLTLLGEVGPGGDLAEGYTVFTCVDEAPAEWQYLAAGWAPLAPAIDFRTPAGVVWDIDEAGVMLLRAGPGSNVTVPRVVPHQTVEITFPRAERNRTGFYTVEDVDFTGQRWIRCAGLGAEDALAEVAIRTVAGTVAAPKWEVTAGGLAVKIYGQVPPGDLTAWLRGRRTTVAELAEHLVVERGPRLAPERVSVALGAAGERPSSLHVPTGAETTTRDELVRQLAAAGGHAVAFAADELRLERIDLTNPAPPVAELTEHDLEPGSLRRRALAAPPAASVVLYAPAYHTAPAGNAAPDAWEPLAAVGRRETERVAVPNPGAAPWPLAREAEGLATPLATRRAALVRAEELNANSLAEIWELTLTRRLDLRIGHKLRLTHSRLARFVAGADAWVIGIPELVAGEAARDAHRLVVELAVPLAKGAAAGEKP